jgi:low affinity Fe/Cu permease
MIKIHKHSEALFEKITTRATMILGNSITFIFALSLVIFWISNEEFYTQSIHSKVGDIIFSITFLSLFIIQKAFNKFSSSLHLKINELVSSHETANNAVINIETKTELEINELSKEYAELAEQLHELEEGKGLDSNTK